MTGIQASRPSLALRRHALLLRQTAKFATTGVVNTVTYYTIYLALITVTAYLVAHLIALALSMVLSYFLNCYWTFRARPTWRTFALWPLTNVATIVVTTVGVALLVGRFHVDQRIAPLVAALGAIPVTFLLSRVVLLGRRPGQSQ